MEPMLLKPVGKDYLWGGNRLKDEFNKVLQLSHLAETWECSTHPDGPSAVANGEFAGKTLVSVLQEHPEYLGTKVDKQYGLPILVKFIDARKDLSIQVHPDNTFARQHENDFGKTEMWYMLEAEDGASLVRGFAHDVSETLVRNAIEVGDLEKHLYKVPVHKGDTFFIPAGTVHGIGAGCLIAEIAESSNVTYRLYDYNRIDRNGKKRELHVDKALQVLNRKTGLCYTQRPRLVQYYPGYNRELLCRCSYFTVERIAVREKYQFMVDATSFKVLLCINGKGEVKTDVQATRLNLKKGDSLFFPAGMGNCILTGECETLSVNV